MNTFLTAVVHRRRFWVMFFFVFLNTLVLCLIYRHETVPYPTGWDAPYYILRIREFVENGIIAQRFGFVFVMGLIHLVTRIPIMTEVAWASPILMALNAAGVASVVYAASRKSLLAFGLTLVVALWSPLNVLLSTGTFDNAFAMVIVFVALWIVRWAGPTWRRGIVLFVVTTAIGWTHLETYIFWLFIAALYEGLQLYRHRSLRGWWRNEFDLLLAVITGGLVTFWHWSSTLNRLATFYTATPSANSNASIPYVHSSTLTTVINYLKTGIADDTVLWIALTALVVLFYRTTRRYGRSTDQLTSYVVAGYAVLLFAIFRGSIPINRAILIIPVNALIGFGLYRLVQIQNRVRLTVGMMVVISSFLVFATPTALIATVQRLNPSISPTTFAAYQSLATYVRDQKIKTFVIIVDIPANELAASAYYSLWTNWLAATRPRGTTTDRYCLYLGSLENYRHHVPTVRLNRQEYNDTSLEGERCNTALKAAYTDQPSVFAIQGIYSSSFLQPAWVAVTKVVAPNVGLIGELPAGHLRK